MGTLGKSLDEWLVDFAAGKPVPDEIVQQLRDTRCISHRRWTKAYINRAQFESPLSRLFDLIAALAKRVDALEKEKGEPERTRPVARLKRKVS